MKKTAGTTAVVLAAAAPLFAQHEHHAPGPTPTPAPAAAVTPVRADPERNLFQSDMALMTGMTPRDPISPTSRWTVMPLAIARLGANAQGGPSGENTLESSNWGMLHAGRGLGPGRLSLMLMLSLEPWTFERAGSPELFQTGETYRGVPIVDRQHPHDFFMNLSATWRAPLSPDAAVWLQVAPVGEPTIGPTAFMHRASAGENPAAPLGHHWQDATHITFNVVTAGFGWKAVSVEGSAFHGEEPDEDRWDIEGGALDSAAGRVRLTFPASWSAQASHAYLHEPEALEEGSTHRTTASIQYGAVGDRPFAATLLWGRNDEEHGASASWLLEGAWHATRADQVYARAEWSEKDAHLLLTKGADENHEHETPDLVEIGALTAGYLRELVVRPALRIGVGGDATAYRVPRRLRETYGDSPVSWHLFFRVRFGAAHVSHESTDLHAHQ